MLTEGVWMGVPRGTSSPRGLTPTRVVLVDDHDLIRAGLVAALAAEPDIEVCGQAAVGATGVRIALDKRPEVMLMDLHLPDMSGIAATKEILASWPQARVMILTASDDPVLEREALAAGAWAYVSKDGDPATVVAAVRSAAQGEHPTRSG